MSGGDQAANFLYLLGCLALVGSGLLAFRLPVGKALKMVLAWVLIFAALFVAFALREDFAALGRRTLAEIRGDNVLESHGGELRVRRAADGHFWIDGEINGRPARFLVDSGATVTTITRRTAESAGIEPGFGPGVIIETANGSTIVQRGQAAQLRLGGIERRDLSVHISDTLGETNVIGMNFLSSLRAWGVEGQVLVLRA